MSVQANTPTGTCKYCQSDFPLPGIQRDYCNEECLYRDKGEKALNTVHNEHTVCSTCGRIRAEVTPPKPDEAFAIDNAYGGAYFSDHDTVSFEAFGQEESAKASVGFRKATVHEQDGACVCGTLERTGDGHFDILHNLETFDTLLRIHQRIKDAAIDGQREDWPSKAELFKTYRETEDLAYSVGKAL